MIPISEHQAIFFTGPLWVGILGALILKEPYYFKEFICAMLSLIGVLFIVKPFMGQEFNFMGYFLVFVASWFYAVLVLILR